MGEAGTSTSSSIWEEIDHSESYLVCSMYEESASIASSVIKRLRDNDSIPNEALYDMMESAGMVFVQSLKELGRTGDILNELRILFVSVTDVPVQVLLTGACFVISQGSYVAVREFLEEFLSKWSYVDERYYVVRGAEKDLDSTEGCGGCFILQIDQYLEVVELYAVTLLGTVLNDVGLAVSWIERASLPEENRQVLLRRLHSLYSLKATNTSQGSLPPADLNEAQSSSLKEPNMSENSSKALNTTYLLSRENVTKQASLNLSRKTYPWFWWFRSNGKVLLGCLIILAYYVYRRKQATLKRVAMRPFLSIKKAVVDLWELAFSYQVNPLAAVQPLPAAPRVTR